jgi:hypothetical protein
LDINGDRDFEEQLKANDEDANNEMLKEEKILCLIAQTA